MPTSAQVDAILKEDYKSYTEQLNNKAFLLAQLKQTSEHVEGRRAVQGIHVGRSGAIGARVEGGTLPTADQQRSQTVPIPLRSQTARIKLTKQLMSMADRSAGAFVTALESEMGIKNDSMRDVNRQLHGQSNGVIATCGTTTTSATIQLLATVTTAAQMRHLYVGRVVDVGTVAAPTTIASVRTITAVDTVNKTITVSGATMSTVSGTHFIFNTSSGGASNGNGTMADGQVECTGLQTIVSASATLHGLTVASNPVWAANVYSNSGTLRAFPETTLDLALLDTTANAGDTPNILLSNSGVFVAGKAVLAAYQRNIDTVEMKGGFQGIKWNTPGISGSGARDIGWACDFDTPANVLYGLNTDSMLLHESFPGWEWMDDDGAILSRVSGELAFEAVLWAFFDLGVVQRNANFLISDITEAS